MICLGLGLDQSLLDASFGRPLFILPILPSRIVLIMILGSLPLRWEEPDMARF